MLVLCIGLGSGLLLGGATFALAKWLARRGTE